MLKWPPEGRGWGTVFLGGLLKPDWLSCMSGMTPVWSSPKVKDRQKRFLKFLAQLSRQGPSLHPHKAKWWGHVPPSP